MLNAFYHLLIRDLRLALRNRHELANPLIFFVLVVSLFPLAVTGVIIVRSTIQAGLRRRFAGSAYAESKPAYDSGVC
jgi:heme exporter protein B